MNIFRKNIRLLIDTNILLDVLEKREPFYKASKTIWKMCETKLTTGFVSALSIANLMYIMRKELNPDQIDKVLLSLSQIFEIEPLYLGDLLHAADLRWNDYEDAIQSVTGNRLFVSYIVTRNLDDYKNSDALAILPEELCDMFEIE